MTPAFIRRGLLAAAVLAPLLPGLASAHAMLHASSPADGAVLDASPRAVELTFMEECRVTMLRLLDESGRERPLRRPAAAMTDRVSAPLGAALPAGSYRLEWRAVGSDGHAMSGTVRFAVAGR